MASFAWETDDMFVDTTFPLDLSVGATVTTEFQTLVTRVDNGFEARNPRWNNALRMYTVRSARTLVDLQTLRQFYIVMRGRQRSFRFRDFQEYSSSAWDGITTDASGNPAPATTSATDQNIGTGDGSTSQFTLRKQYTVAGNTINRLITKPVSGTVKIAVGGTELTNTGSPSDWHIDYTTGVVSLATTPTLGQAVTAGFWFDVPVRFDTDMLAAEFVSTIELEVPQVVLREVRE